MFVCSEEAVCPDFLCLSRGLTAVIFHLRRPSQLKRCTKRSWEIFVKIKPSFMDTHLPQMHCTALSVKSIEKLEPMIASGAIDQRIRVFEKKIIEHLEGHPFISEIRQRGWLAGSTCRVVKGKRH